MTALLYSLLYLLSGLLIIRCQLPRKSPLVRLWIGLALGILLEMWLPNLMAYAFGFTIAAHIAAIVPLAALTGVMFLMRDRRPVSGMQEGDRAMLAALALVVIPLGVLSGYLQYTHVLRPASDGSLWCGQATYGDLCMHLAFTTSIAGMAFPPSYSLLAGTSLSYPYLTDSLSSTLWMMGVPLNMAVILPGTLLMMLTYAGYMLLARRCLGNRPKLLAVCALLFFLNGGLGFLYDFDLAFKDHFAKILDIFTGYYHTPANQPELNLRWSNVIADLLIPQRSLMGGWAMVLPVFWLLIDSQRLHSMRETLLLAVWAGAMPLVHTHTFLALGLFSGGYILARFIMDRGNRRRVLLQAAVYLGIVLVLALPQLLGHAVRQTLEGGSLRFQFNWVNNSGGRGFIDGYLWFWVKNAGLPFLLLLFALPDIFRRGHGDLFLGMTAIFLVAETVIFQPNEYDNNKLFYIWFMFAVMLSADYGSVIMRRLEGLRGRWLLCGFFMIASVLSGSLALAREAVSGYQLFSANAVAAGDWIRENTEKDAVFLTGQQHINPVASLAGRQILCGSDLYVFFHGLDYSEQEAACEAFYEDPVGNRDILDRYGVDYIYVSDYERSDFAVDTDALDENWTLVYENADVSIYKVENGSDSEGSAGT